MINNRKNARLPGLVQPPRGSPPRKETTKTLKLVQQLAFPLAQTIHPPPQNKNNNFFFYLFFSLTLSPTKSLILSSTLIVHSLCSFRLHCPRNSPPAYHLGWHFPPCLWAAPYHSSYAELNAHLVALRQFFCLGFARKTFISGCCYCRHLASRGSV